MRAADIVPPGLALAVLGPACLAVAVAIKACDHGPVLCRPKRLTQNGRVFESMKFQEMQVVRGLHKTQATIRTVIYERCTRFSLPSDFRHSIAGFAGVFAA